MRDTPAAILEAAARILPTNSGTTLAEVAAAAGLGRTTVHRYFPTREDLLAALAVDALDRIEAALADCRLDDGPVPDVLARVAAALVPMSDEFRFLEVGPEVWKVGGELDTRWYRLSDRLEAVVDRGKRDGDLRPDLPTAWIVDLVASAVWCAGDSIRDGRVAPREAPRLLVEVLLHGAATRREP
ncbi:MAG: TetR/AcrR family transcriptional regulator [Kineosporiaceae bacterium]